MERHTNVRLAMARSFLTGPRFYILGFFFSQASPNMSGPTVLQKASIAALSSSDAPMTQ